jgi:glycine hydroxymethyltransferase
MFTTHKTIRGPRGAVLLVTEKGLKKDPDLGNKIDKAVFPGLQGGPHNNTTAAIAVCLKEASSPKFNTYSKQVVKNAQTLAEELKKYGFNLVSDGTDNHLILINLENKGIDGWCAAWALEYAGIVLNRNSVPFDAKSPFYPSGIRMGTPAITTRGMKEREMKRIAFWINKAIDVAKTLVDHDKLEKIDKVEARKLRNEFKVLAQNNKELKEISKEIKDLCKRFPLP